MVFKLQRVQPRKKEKPETVIINEVIIESLPWIINPLSPLQIHNIIDILCYFGHFVPPLVFVTFNKKIRLSNKRTNSERHPRDPVLRPIIYSVLKV